MTRYLGLTYHRDGSVSRFGKQIGYVWKDGTTWTCGYTSERAAGNFRTRYDAAYWLVDNPVDTTPPDKR